MSSKQITFSEISPSEFFYRNRDLAGFSNPTRALYSATRELTENSLDACELSGILPKVDVVISSPEPHETDPRQYTLTIVDNGPGIPTDHLPMAFGRVFYGSKFKLRQSRGVFGLGGTMAILYGQITTNKPVRITTSEDGIMKHIYELMINIQENRPIILNRSDQPSDGWRGTRVELNLEGDYRSGQKIQEYFRETALVTPYAELSFLEPSGESHHFQRAIEAMPSPPKETLPHPHGVDVETVRRLIRLEKVRVIDVTPNVLKEKVKDELGISPKDLCEAASATYRVASQLLSNGSGAKAIQMRDLNQQVADGIDRSLLRLIGSATEKWNNLSRPVKTFVSLSVVAGLDPKQIPLIATDALDFAKDMLITGDGGNGPDVIRPLLHLEPFRDHLLSLYGGDSLVRFLTRNFHRVGENIARKFLDFARLDYDAHVRALSNEQVVQLVHALHMFDGFLMPDSSCLSPLGEDILRAGIEKQLQPEFVTLISRLPAAYSGFPFIVEVGIAYGGKVLGPGIKLFRFANRIPLLYDETSDVSWKVISEEIDLRRYRVPPDAPIGVVTHICSTKVPYKSVGKEYLADRPEVEKELKNAMRDALRRLSGYLSRKGSAEMQKRKLNIYAKYLPLIAKFSAELAGSKKVPDYKRLLSHLEGQSTIEEYNNS